MAAFYSTIEGNRGPATRCGSKGSGIHAAVQSWQGSVSTTLYTAEDGSTYCRIVAGRGSTAYPSGQTVYNGPLADLVTGSVSLSPERSAP